MGCPRSRLGIRLDNRMGLNNKRGRMYETEGLQSKVFLILCFYLSKAQAHDKNTTACSQWNEPHKVGIWGLNVATLTRVFTGRVKPKGDRCLCCLLEIGNGEGTGEPLQYSCLETPMDGGAWWAAVHGVTKSRTRLRDFTFTFHFHALEKEMATHSSVPAWRIPVMG